MQANMPKYKLTPVKEIFQRSILHSLKGKSAISDQTILIFRQRLESLQLILTRMALS